MLTVLFYRRLLVGYLEIASDKSTEIKTSFLGLEPFITDTMLLLLSKFYSQENLGKFWYPMLFKSAGIKICGYLISRFYSIRDN